MTKLKISDNDNIICDDEFQRILNDSSCEMDNEDSGNALFIGKQQFNNMYPPTSKDKDEEDVAEAISPGGHCQATCPFQTRLG